MKLEVAHFALAFASAPGLKPLTLLHRLTRRVIMQKARRHPELIIGLRPLVSVWFQVLFHSPHRGSFHLSLALLFAIGHQGVLSLAGWAPRIHARFHETGATREIHRRHIAFAYGAITLFGATFQTLPLTMYFLTPW